MLKILGRKTSSNVQKVLWCCEEIGLPFERTDIGGEFGKNKEPEYLALNPNGLVPTINDDGFVLWESNSCVRYLAAKYGKGKLWPADAQLAASASRWMDWQLSTLNAPVGTLFRAYLRKEDLPAADIEAARKRGGEVWKMLDAQLAKTPFVAGSELTVGDIAMGNAIHRWYKFPIERPDLTNLKAWYGRLCARPAYQKHIGSL
ncbi:MAG: glutathione S-transferase family protein [Betaproteobacteria bacterium]|nr:glutathione S-transferase family protein [Betaproteobacteria bacterium]